MLKDDFGFAVVCKKTQTLGDILLKKGRKVEQQYRRNTVYSIPECPMKYVGQTSVPLKKRCKEHENWCRKKQNKLLNLKSTTKNDGIAYHHHFAGHAYEIYFENIYKNPCRRNIIRMAKIDYRGT